MVGCVKTSDQSMQLLTLSHAHDDQRAGKKNDPFSFVLLTVINVITGRECFYN